MTTILRISTLLTVSLLSLPVFHSAADAQDPDTVFAGSPVLGGLLPPLGTDTIYSYVDADGKRSPLNVAILTISEGGEGADGYWRIVNDHVSLPGNDTTSTLIIFRKSDFSLVHHKVSAPGDSASVTVSGNRLTGWVVLPGEPPSLLDLELPHPVLPVDGPSPWFFSLLPLRDGYTAVVPRFSMWSGGEVWKTYSVVASEFVEAGEQTYACWKVDAGPLGPPGYTAFCWVDKSSRRVVQSALLNPDGGTEYWSYTR